MPNDRKTTLAWTVGIEVVLAILVLINRRPLGDIILMILMAVVATGAAVILLSGSGEKRRERSWAQARRAAKWERRTRTSYGETRVYLVQVARNGDETEEFGPTEQVGASISSEDPAWHALVLDREAKADERLFLLNRTTP